ncbi:MAG: DUF3592 domain-containing protein [Chthoniobacteraceae bacterium]
MRRTRTSAASTPKTIAQKGCGTVFFGMFALFGVLIFAVIARSLVETARTYFWEETPCTILEARRLEAGADDDFIVRYRYMVEGRSYTSSRYTMGMKESLDSSKIERLISRYPAGGNTLCHVNLKKPGEAVLQRGSLWIGLVLLFPLIFVAIGAFGIVSVWREKGLAGVITTRRKGGGAVEKFGPIFFFGIFAIVGGVLFYFLTLRTMKLYFDARSWPETPCTIVSSSVGSHRSTSNGKTSTTYSVDIVYSYVVGRREYRSDRYGIMGGSSSGRAGKAAVVARHRPGTKAVCFVNPNDPTDALLNRELSGVMFIGLLPAVFLLIGVIGLFATVRTMLKSSGTVTIPGVPTLPGQQSVPLAQSVVPGGIATGPAVLEPSASPKAKFIGAVIVALFWNGITSVFVVSAVKSWSSGTPEIFLSLIMIPFLLVGLALVGVSVAMFLNLFNPRIALVVSSQSAPLGGTIDFRWNFRGAVARIRSLRIVLEGREEARYRSGKNAATDRKVFAQLAIVETDDPGRIREGQAQFVVPDNVMHSWDGGDNKIIWQLQVRGEIPRYPDVSEDFDFTVLPNPR